MISKGITRRAFITYGAMGVAFAGISPGNVLALCKSTNTSDNKFLFADQPSLGPDVNAPLIERQCCVLHQEVALPDIPVDTLQYRNIHKLLKEEFHNTGLHWDDSYKIGFTFQHYGVPDQSIYTANLLDYCQQAQHYLYGQLANLVEVNINWHQLIHNNSHNHSNGAGFRGFVGRYTYYVLRAVVTNAPEQIDAPYLVSAWPLERAIHYIVTGSTYRPIRGTVYVIPGTTSLVAPFSELLHVTLHAPSQRYAAELENEMSPLEAQKLARIAGETTNEAAATLMATEYLNSQGCSDRITSIETVAKSMAKQYTHLPQSINFMRRVGVQEALKIYQDSPAEFMRRIG